MSATNQKSRPHRIEIPLGIIFPSVNCYLIPGKKLSLIDTGFYSEDNWELLKKEINHIGFKVSDIDQVIITHEHIDHIGLLPKLLDESHADILVPRKAKHWFTDPEISQLKERKFRKNLFDKLGLQTERLQSNDISKVSLITKLCTPFLDRFSFYKEQDILCIGNNEWIVYHTPGHCNSQHVIINKKDLSILSGDMLLPIAPMPIIEEDLNLKSKQSNALEQLVESYQKLLKLNIETVYPGHGPIFNNAHQVIRQQLDRIDMRKKECFRLIQKGLKNVLDIQKIMYPQQDPNKNFSGIFMILGYLDLLKKEHKLTVDFNEKNSFVIGLH